MMFDTSFYLAAIKHYPPDEQSVQYIEEWYDIRLIDDPMTFIDEVDLRQPPDAFNLNNIDSGFYIINDGYPQHGTIIATPFDGSNIYKLFSFYSGYDFPSPIQPVAGVDYNNIATNFSQDENELPIATQQKPIAVDYNNIYSGFTVSNVFFHGYPMRKINIPAEVEPEDWTKIYPTNIDKNIEIRAQQFDIELSEQLTTNFVYPAVKDRDEYYDEYKIECEKYWNFYER